MRYTLIATALLLLVAAPVLPQGLSQGPSGIILSGTATSSGTAQARFRVGVCVAEATPTISSGSTAPEACSDLASGLDGQCEETPAQLQAQILSRIAQIETLQAEADAIQRRIEEIHTEGVEVEFSCKTRGAEALLARVGSHQTAAQHGTMPPGITARYRGE